MLNEFLESPYLMIFLGFNTLIGGFVIFYKGYRLLRKNNETQKWASTKAIIKESRIEEYRDDELKKMYKLAFKYSYIVKGIEYNSEGRYLEKESGQSWIGKLKEFTERNKVSNEIIAYYNPLKPEESVILTRKKTIYIISISTGIVFFTIGIIVIYNNLKFLIE